MAARLGYPQFICVAVTFVLLVVSAGSQRFRGCLDVPVNEGLASLRNGDMVCAKLANYQPQRDQGKRYIVCSNGEVNIMTCPGPLRFDTVSKSCSWPRYATCRLPANISYRPVGHFTPAPTNPPPITVRPTTRPTRRPTTPRTWWPPVYTTRPTRQPPTPRTWWPPIYTTRPTVRPPTRPTNPPQTFKPPSWLIPTAYPEGPCNPQTCQLPSCFCYGDVPHNVPKSQTPQFLMLTFDDAITGLNFQRYYLPLLMENKFGLVNPSGCKAKATFYVSHAYTDYDLVQKLYNEGNEIASHTIHHRMPRPDITLSEVQAEIQGLKEMMMQHTHNRELFNDVRGFRAPFLKVAGDNQFEELMQDHFEYDTSILNARTQSNKKPLWPFTLDYVIPSQECINPPCPTKPYPGIWEVPLNSWMDDRGFPCSMVDECYAGVNPNTATEQEWYGLMQRNFEEHFYRDKIPMPFFMHSSLFQRNANAFKALVRFFRDTLSRHEDVWMATPRQVLGWMKNQQPNSEMARQRWGCH